MEENHLKMNDAKTEFIVLRKNKQPKEKHLG